MIHKNMQMIEGMINRHDYEEYVGLCKKNDVQIRDKQQFSMGIGTLEVGRTTYPDLSWQDAYTQMFKDINAQDKAECCGNEKKDKPLPSLVNRAKTYAKAQIDHTRAGRQLVAKAEYLKRLTTCSGCSRLNNDWNCSHPKCGCQMKVKAEWAEQICHDNNW